MCTTEKFPSKSYRGLTLGYSRYRLLLGCKATKNTKNGGRRRYLPAAIFTACQFLIFMLEYGNLPSVVVAIVIIILAVVIAVVAIVVTVVVAIVIIILAVVIAVIPISWC